MIEVRSPDTAMRWRFTPEGPLERSTNSGATWERLELSPPAVLTSGHAPGGTAAWLVGKGGAIYATADGARFERLSFPEVVDLASVTAIDERRATVITADGRRFATADRGITWMRQ